MKDFLKDNWLTILILVAGIVLAILLGRSCSKQRELNDEISRYENNIKALNDTLKNYKDGTYQCAEMRALQLRVDELEDSLKLERGKEPITIVRYITVVADTVYADGEIIHDTTLIYGSVCDAGSLTLHSENTFGKSSRVLDATIPYKIDTLCNMETDEGKFTINQNIWLDATVYYDKNGESFLRLKTDYPGITFNSGTAIAIADRPSEKKRHFGVCIGPAVGYGAVISNNGKLVSGAPYIGIGASIGWCPDKLKF